MRLAGFLIAAGAALLLAAPAGAAGDPARGSTLHQDCLGCHGTELYVPPRAKVKSLSALKKETEKWNDRMNPKFTRQEIEDLVAYLNRDFYKLSR
jgi:mono/diheme cytochrome c family protein